MKILERKQITTNDLDDVSGTAADLPIKRNLRQPLLNAFDIYKSNVYYGVIVESAAEHTAILEWYKSLLDLDRAALENPPAAIKKYIK